MNTSKYSSAKKVLNMLGVSEINFGKLLKNHRLGEELTLAQMSKVYQLKRANCDYEIELKAV